MKAINRVVYGIKKMKVGQTLDSHQFHAMVGGFKRVVVCSACLRKLVLPKVPGLMEYKQGSGKRVEFTLLREWSKADDLVFAPKTGNGLPKIKKVPLSDKILALDKKKVKEKIQKIEVKIKEKKTLVAKVKPTPIIHKDIDAEIDDFFRT